MTLILIEPFKFESTDKFNRINDVIILKTMKTRNCQYLGNTITYEVEIWYVEVIYDADLDYGIEILIN